MRQIIISMIDDLYRAFDKKTVTTHIRERTARRLQNIRNQKKSLQQHSVSQKQCSPLQTAGLILDDSIKVIEKGVL